MKKSIVILNGIHLSYNAILYAIEWAKENSGSVHVLYLQGKKESSTNYMFPSDLTLAETSSDEKQALEEDKAIIATNLKIIKEMLETEKINYNIELKTDVQLNEVVNATADAELLIADIHFDDTVMPMRDNNISLKNLRHKAHCAVKVVVD